MNETSHFRFTPSVWIVPTMLLLSVWGVFWIEEFFNLNLSQFGILPRTFSGLIGILASPLLHGDMNHLLNNSLPLFILTAALVYFYRNLSLKVLFYGVLLSGFITWLIGRDSYHIGASGLIYVLVSFIFFKGLVTKYYRLMALSMAVVLLYGGMIWYVFPDVDKTISWEGHLGGLIAGYIFALRFKTPDYQKELVYDWQQPDYDPTQDKFMQRFDENGNFVNPPSPEPEPEILPDEPTSYRIVYDFIPEKKKIENN